MNKKHECSGCPHWKWHPKDRLYGNPGYHLCSEPDFCERFCKTKIKRDEVGYITDAGFAEMIDALPIEVFANFDNKPHRRISTPEELEDYLFGAIPYACTIYYRSKKDGKD